MLQAVALSKAPIIASHSAARSLANVSRNMDDEMLKALEQNGGVIQTVAFGRYLKTDSIERTSALAALGSEFGVTVAGAGSAAQAPPRAPRAGAGAAAAPCPVDDGHSPAAIRSGPPGPVLNGLSAERRAQYDRRLSEIDARFPPARATVKDFVDHIDYLVKRIGIDHVGISSDFDGGGGIDGWNSAAETFNVTIELVRRGYTEEQIGKIWSGNLLRVWTEVERVAKGIQAGTIK
jgi:membrane dipeptidase